MNWKFRQEENFLIAFSKYFEFPLNSSTQNLKAWINGGNKSSRKVKTISSQLLGNNERANQQ